MNKQKWTEKPVTWGGYLKLSGIVTVIGAIFSAVYILSLIHICSLNPHPLVPVVPVPEGASRSSTG